MKQYFVPYDIAKELKEIGFELDNYPAWVFGDGSSKEPHLEWRTAKGCQPPIIGLPLYDQVISYLWEKYRIDIQYSPSQGKDFLNEQINKAIRNIQDKKSGK